MTAILLILFLISLLYIAITNRLNSFINILAFQGIILFGVAFIELIKLDFTNLLFILLETIIFKTIILPAFLTYVVKKNNITRETEPFVPNFLSIVIVTVIILISFTLSQAIHDDHINKLFFIVAVSALFTGLYIIITRKNIITHVMGYLVIENGVFILSLAVGSEMPMLLNTGILLDIFVSVVLLGVFANKIGEILQGHDIDQLRKLKD
ncbi:MAG: hypothetical protein PSX36_06385 [bacterium]|nr:hypothetical protein [bacterium]